MVRDPRTSEADSKRFLDMMERYFSQDVSAKMADARPELHYQVVACLNTKRSSLLDCLPRVAVAWC